VGILPPTPCVDCAVTFPGIRCVRTGSVYQGAISTGMVWFDLPTLLTIPHTTAFQRSYATTGSTVRMTVWADAGRTTSTTHPRTTGTTPLPHRAWVYRQIPHTRIHDAGLSAGSTAMADHSNPPPPPFISLNDLRCSHHRSGHLNAYVLRTPFQYGNGGMVRLSSGRTTHPCGQLVIPPTRLYGG